MDCDSCGRYRPSQEIAPLREPGGHLVMACVRCRRLATEVRRLVVPAAGTTVPVAAGSARPVSPH